MKPESGAASDCSNNLNKPDLPAASFDAGLPLRGEEELGGSRAARQKGVMKCFNVITNAGGAAVWIDAFVFSSRCVNISYFTLYGSVLTSFARLILLLCVALKSSS